MREKILKLSEEPLINLINLSSGLADPVTSSKTYWSILKAFLNNKKIPCIILLFHENKVIKELNYLTISL